MILRVAIFSAAVFLAAAQIEKPPDFDDKPAFRQGAPGALDSTSHIAGRSETIAANLVLLLDSFVPAAGDSVEYRLFTAAHGHIRRRHLAASSAAFEDAAKRHPESVSLTAGAIVTRHLTGRYDESATALLALARRFPHDPRLIPLLGETAGSAPAHRAEFEAALRAFTLAIPTHAGARFHLARLLAEGAPALQEEALMLWKESAQLDPRDPRPCLELARTATAAGRAADAIGWLKQALDRDPALPDAHYRLSRLYAKQGDHPRASRHLSEYQKLKGK